MLKWFILLLVVLDQSGAGALSAERDVEHQP